MPKDHWRKEDRRLASHRNRYFTPRRQENKYMSRLGQIKKAASVQQLKLVGRKIYNDKHKQEDYTKIEACMRSLRKAYLNRLSVLRN